MSDMNHTFTLSSTLATFPRPSPTSPQATGKQSGKKQALRRQLARMMLVL